MRREDKRLVKFSIVAITFSLVTMYGVGKLMLLAHPLSDLDKKCMNVTMSKLNECWTQNEVK